ncbi:putative transcriptional regulatory protein [Hibiscus syriacus]|uniref:Transcriptional regulatory protein n=1 Tax=Hibiscus syriacus TaxID=106335 RepID=A0A6A3CSU8_HIBSY|nr:putative transcriptional regulatory protein [Hibiscus syriacus]
MGSSSTVRAVGAVLHIFTNGVPSSSLIVSRNGILKSMGRRSSKVAGRKGAQDAKKAKVDSKIGKEIVSAIKRGGTNPASNTVLAAVIEKAKELDIPKEILERNIKRAVMVELAWRVRVVNIKFTDADKDQLLDIALDAGAEDVIEPPTYEDDTGEDRSENYYKIVSSAENYGTILSKLREEGIKFETDNGSELIPLSTIEVDDEAMDLNKELMSKLLELGDVDAVYTDQK